MNSRGRFWIASMLVTGALILAACGGGGGGGGGGGNLTVTTDGENLAFAPTSLTVAAGSQVSLTFNNTSTAQQHNWVLVNGGDDLANQVDDASLDAGPPNYLPSGSADVIAATDMLQPGGSGSITFTAPAAGTYTFLCTYPAHYAGGMKGTLTVQ
ncbi:MAG TPA: plastocyanin/azurin family copper-binding protein [Roseiflexaceae bacterium]|nr:plastocyanin/azurin family copper-binding protein [Roseiflexaceae bacterium]HMP43228.1 plastocyanin/azurin family copper-binding protein [Roseiflexaceae bacterium]